MIARRRWPARTRAPRTARWFSYGASFCQGRAIDAKRSQLAVQIGALNPQRLCRVADSSAMLLEHVRDVLAFKTGASLAQRAAVEKRRGSAIKLDLSEHVFEPDPLAARKTADDRLEHRPQLHRVAASRQRRDQRQRGSRQRLWRDVSRPADFPEKVVRQCRDVFTPAPNRRHLDPDDRQPPE